MYFKTYLLKNTKSKKDKNYGKIEGIQFTCGYHCMIAYRCPNGHKCKYRKGFKFHNFSVSIKNFFTYDLGINLPRFIYFNKFITDLSGTITCPFKMPREENCWRCKFAGAENKCTNKTRSKLISEGKFEETERDNKNSHVCKFFERSDYFYCFNKKTGDMDYDSYIETGMKNYKGGN